MTELQRDTLAYGVVAAASAYLLIWIILINDEITRGQRRDNPSHSGTLWDTV